jgi:hypothetical protein
MGLKFLLLALFGLSATALQLQHAEDKAPVHQEENYEGLKYAWYNAEEKEDGAC